ncbi:aldose 1-epimerase [Aurantiacibacter spongiae]|uniref:Aldose 1-epimerase n=1 Tax=Aurantiacibacter spongiae TaxID=2488860 RepID=A0A3N5DGY5_9SPHN|nr:aldose 1-epimerase [Aurantiacibacter spongiae]RPF70932.1 aldose 1-epimerase [Aurantiacibacter spongiae]
MIELRAGKWRAVLRPQLGGSLVSLTCGDLPVLRETTLECDDVLQSACFPLVPFCNRVAEGQFDFGGSTVRLEPNLPPQRHPLHGFGWRREWRTVRSDRHSALMEDEYAAGEWPWPYRAHQHVALDEDGCTIRLLAENRSDRTAPMGLGLHPYFRRGAETVVAFEARGMMGIDEEFLPDGSVEDASHVADFTAGAALPERLVDNCFVDWTGTATISDRLGAIRLRAFGAPHCHVFSPTEEPTLCIEPISHTPDALNRAPGEMISLPSCAAAAIALRIEADGPL